MIAPGVVIRLPHLQDHLPFHVYGKLNPEGSWCSLDLINKPAPSEALSWEEAMKQPWMPWASTPGVTDWDRAVWAALIQIPQGQTRTYSQVAQMLKAPQSQRAVARACSRNRWALIVPCHRVVGANDTGGYKWGVEIKRALLDWERKNPLPAFQKGFKDNSSLDNSNQDNFNHAA